MFSKELAQLDKNTVQYMIDEMQNEIDDMKRQLEEKDDTMNSIISEKAQEIALLKEKLKNLKVE